MPGKRRKLRVVRTQSEAAELDERLAVGVAAGDAAALSTLMDRYDGLVRYTVFDGFQDSCRRDPLFLDARSSEVWSGFVESIRRRGSAPPGDFKAYLVRITRNKCTDFLRRTAREPAHASTDSEGQPDGLAVEDPSADPLAVILEMERAEVLRSCMRELPSDDRKLLEIMDLLVKSRWAEAARTLDIRESTLRSRWQRVLDRLRLCMEKKLRSEAESFAPQREDGDS